MLCHFKDPKLSEVSLQWDRKAVKVIRHVLGVCTWIVPFHTGLSISCVLFPEEESLMSGVTLLRRSSIRNWLSKQFWRAGRSCFCFPVSAIVSIVGDVLQCCGAFPASKTHCVYLYWIVSKWMVFFSFSLSLIIFQREVHSNFGESESPWVSFSLPSQTYWSLSFESSKIKERTKPYLHSTVLIGHWLIRHSFFLSTWL